MFHKDMFQIVLAMEQEQILPITMSVKEGRWTNKDGVHQNKCTEVAAWCLLHPGPTKDGRAGNIRKIVQDKTNVPKTINPKKATRPILTHWHSAGVCTKFLIDV